MLRISKEQLARNADKARGVARGKEGLNILIHGWLKYRKYWQKYREVIWHRKWLYITEAMDLAEYAGCDLMKNEA